MCDFFWLIKGALSISLFVLISLYEKCLHLWLGLWESFEVDGWVVRVSDQSRDILFKKREL